MPSSNNFDLLRLLFASMVCIVHAQQLSGFAELTAVTSHLSSVVAVKAFFVVSGYLIFMSFDRSASVSSYAEKRLRRIYPAYFTVVALSAIGLSSVSDLSWSEYFGDAWLRYVIANLTFMNFIKPELPGVFAENQLQAVNGALWTLKIEVMFYLSVPFFAYVFRRFGRTRSLLLFYILSTLYAYVCAELATRTGRSLFDELGRQLPGQLSYFLAGTFYYFYSARLNPYLGYLALASIGILSIDNAQTLLVLEPIALATLVLFAATFKNLGNFGKFGDFSYGVYILHFPIIQLLIHYQFWQDSPWLFLVMAYALTVIGAVLMWHCVEKHFLSRASHYVFASSK